MLFAAHNINAIFEFQKVTHACAFCFCLGVYRPFASDTSPKRIDREGLGKRRTGTTQEHGFTKRTNVLRPKKIPTYTEHGRTKRTNVPRPKKIPTYIEHGRTKRTNVLRPKKIATYMRTLPY